VGIVGVRASSNGVATARVGLAVPGVRGAVNRNRIRRRLRAAGAGLTAHGGFDLVVSAGGEALTLPFADLRAQVSEAARMAVARAGARRAAETSAGRPAGGGGRPAGSRRAP
jgi:ribonuclease P protein component